jgi:carbon-monoxide dehydrogenase medium subunit
MDEDALANAADAIEGEVDPDGEVHADEEYKREVAAEYGRRGLQSAHERATR